MVIQRQLNSDEREKINRLISVCNSFKKKDLKFLLGYEIIVGLIASYSYFQIDREWLWLFVFSLITFIGIGVWNFLGDSKTHKQSINRYQEYLSANTVESVSVDVEKYYLFEYGISENEYYLFELPGNRILSLINMGFYDYQDGFPGSNFEIVVLKNARGETEILDVSVYGETSQPLKTITGKARESFYNSRFYPNSDTYAIIGGNLNDVDKILT